MFNHIFTNQELLASLDACVYGHTEAKKALIRAINRQRLYYQQYHKQNQRENLVKLQNVLLVGPSGTGKTFLIETLAKVVDFNLIKFDATQIIPSGASGKFDIPKIIKAIKESCADWASASSFTEEQIMHQTVVFIDEIDKLTIPHDSSGNWSRNVQANLLQLVENKTDLDGVVFVFAGAFVHLYENNIAKKTKKSLGFATQLEETFEEQFHSPLEDLIVKNGMLPELAGRIGTIVALEGLEEKHYVEIIQNFLLPEMTRELADFNITDFTLSEKDVRAIAERALKSNQGVRSARRELSKLTADLEFNYPEPVALIDYLSEFDEEDLNG